MGRSSDGRTILPPRTSTKASITQSLIEIIGFRDADKLDDYRRMSATHKVARVRENENNSKLYIY